MASNVNQHNQLLQLFAAYAKRLDKLYDDFVNRLIASLPYSEDEVWERLADDPLFRFDQLPYLSARLQHIFDDYVNKQVLCYKAGITDGVALAFSQDKINLGKYTILQDEAIKAARNAAVASFIANRMSRKEGLSLSDKVWNYSQLGKSEVEMGISNVLKDGLKAGTSAEELGRKVRQYLNNPTMMYRRYWVTVADHAGNKKKVARWYRRHIDEKTGKVTFSNEPLEKVGMGVYRSARMNGYRLMRTEINMSYHKANASRWANEPFVYGIRVWRSPQHPRPDICDELEGYYPKDFVFEGWHVQCICASAPLTLYGDEKREFYRRLMKGEDMSNFHSKYEITEENMNPNWKRYIENNHDAIKKAASRGKLAYFLRDNKQFWINSFSKAEQREMGMLKSIKEIADARHAARTEEQAKDIADRWHEHKRVDALVRKANKLVADLREYPLAGNWKMLQEAIDNRNAHDLELFLGNKMLSKRLLYEELITPDKLKWSEFVKNFYSEETATFIQNQMSNIVREARKEAKLSDALNMLAKNARTRIEDNLVGKELNAYLPMYDREVRRMRDYYEFQQYKKDISNGIEYLKKNIVVAGGGVAKVPPINVSEFYLDDITHMKTLSDNISVMKSNIETLVNNASFVASSKSPIIRQLYDGIKYALQRDGLMADVDDLIAKLDSNIARLKKEAKKTVERKAEKATIAKVSNPTEIEKTLVDATKDIKLKGNDRYMYYTQLTEKLESMLTYRKDGEMPKALQSRKKLLFDAIKADISDSRIKYYYERYRHGIAVLETWDRMYENGLRSALGNINEMLKNYKIRFKKVEMLDNIDENAIISKLCGGDMTSGSCSSLALSYAGNKNGLDVRDFRGGKSCDFFSSTGHIKQIVSNCRGTVIEEYDDYVAAKKALKLVEKGKEYYFACARHAAIVRRTDSGLEYLELQSSVSNGFKPLTEERLQNRFDCKHQHTRYGYKFKGNAEIIEVGKFGKDKGFRDMLGYINTAEKSQKKGASGSIK